MGSHVSCLIMTPPFLFSPPCPITNFGVLVTCNKIVPMFKWSKRSAVQSSKRNTIGGWYIVKDGEKISTAYGTRLFLNSKVHRFCCEEIRGDWDSCFVLIYDDGVAAFCRLHRISNDRMDLWRSVP